MKHDYYFVYEVLKRTILHIRTNIQIEIKKMYFVSDGSPNQYKCLSNFLNICFCKEDFDVVLEWIFFATSHGKSPCDGLGGTAKRLTTRESLQRTVNNQITCAMEMFDYCSQTIEAIQFYFVAKEDMMELRDEQSFLSERYDTSKLYYLPGTKGYHHFVPLSTEVIAVKTVSTDEEYDSILNFRTGKWDDESGLSTPVTEVLPATLPGALPTALPSPIVSGGEFVVCEYGKKQWIGTVLSVDDSEKDWSLAWCCCNTSGPKDLEGVLCTC